MSQLYDGHCRRKALKGLFCFCCFQFFSLFFLSLLLLLFCYWYSFLGIHHLRYSHKMNSCHSTPAPTIKPAFFFFLFDIVQVVTSYRGHSTEHSKSCAGTWRLHFPSYSQWGFCASEAYHSCPELCPLHAPVFLVCCALLAQDWRRRSAMVHKRKKHLLFPPSP